MMMMAVFFFFYPREDQAAFLVINSSVDRMSTIECKSESALVIAGVAEPFLHSQNQLIG